MSESDRDQQAIRSRPPVTMASLLGAVAGLLLLGSLSGFLSELSGDRLRVGGLGLSLMFEALGVVLLVLSQGRRAHTAGVTLAALGTIPLVFFVFFDLNDASNSLIGGDDLALTASLALLVAAGLWLAGHVFGPSQSHALFLGAALVAVWLAVVIQVADDGGGRTTDVFGAPAFRTAPGVLVPASTSDIAVDGEDAIRAMIEGERFMGGRVVCNRGRLVAGNPEIWSCEGDHPYPSEFTGASEFQALEGERFRVPFDDLDYFGPYDSNEAAWRLYEFERYDRGEIRCEDGRPTGSDRVWSCDFDDELLLWEIQNGWEVFEGDGHFEDDLSTPEIDDLTVEPRFRPTDDPERRAVEFEKYDAGDVVCEGGYVVQGDPTFWTCEDDDLVFPIDGSGRRLEPFDPDRELPSPFDDEWQDFSEFEDLDEFSQFDEFDDDPFGPGEFTVVEDPFFSNPFDGVIRRIGWTTFLFGAAYLAAAVILDRRRDHRRATAFFAVASPLLYLGVNQVAGDSVRANGLALMVAGGVSAWAGSRANRRFTSWLGAYVGAGGLITLVLDEVGDSGSAIGFTLLVLGLALAALAIGLERPPSPEVPAGAAPTGTPGPGADGAAPPGIPTTPTSTATAAQPLAPPPGSHAGASSLSAPPSTPPVAPPGGTPLGNPSDDPTVWQPPTAPAPFDPRPPGSHDPLPQIGPDPSEAPGPEGPKPPAR